MNITATLTHAAERLEANGVAEPRREAVSLLGYALGRDRTFLFAHPEYELSDDETEGYICLIARRCGREPYQYIVGKREFYGLDFEVSPDVLIPRPETEILVEHAIDLLKGVERPHFLEIGVGSGCIAISVLKNIPTSTAVGVDISERALAITKRNAGIHDVSERLMLAVSDIYDATGDEIFDAILSNPPYIPAADLATLQPEVREYEPESALTDGGDGLGLIREIVGGAPSRLKPGGLLMIEFGFGQTESVLNMFIGEMWCSTSVIADMQEIPRIVIATLCGISLDVSFSG